MKIGISLTATANGVSSHDSIDYCRWAAKYADQAGFDAIWTTEHHFTDIAHTGAPSAALAYYAGVTEQAKLGYGVAIVPLHHPLRFAEELLWVDNLSDGRLVGGISPGWSAYEFELFGVPLDDRRERFAEAWEIIRQACNGETVTLDGQFWKVPGLFINPPPRQAHIPFVMSVGKIDSVKLAAKWRLSPVFGAPPVSTIIENCRVFEETARADGADDAEIARLREWTGVRRFITIGRTEEEAREESGIHSRRLEASLNFLSTTKSAEGSAQSADPRQPRNLSNEIHGTVDTVIEQLLDLDKIGMGHFICNFTLGSRGLEGAKDMIRLFSKEVLPALNTRQPVAARS